MENEKNRIKINKYNVVSDNIQYNIFTLFSEIDLTFLFQSNA